MEPLEYDIKHEEPTTPIASFTVQSRQAWPLIVEKGNLERRYGNDRKGITIKVEPMGKEATNAWIGTPDDAIELARMLVKMAEQMKGDD